MCAVFKAVGLASYELYEEIEFDAWFSTTLLDLFRLPTHTSLQQQSVGKYNYHYLFHCKPIVSLNTGGIVPVPVVLFS